MKKDVENYIYQAFNTVYFNTTQCEEAGWQNISSYFICFSGGTSCKEPACQCRRCKRLRFSPWIGKISWRKPRQLTPVFLPGESYGQRNLADDSTSTMNFQMFKLDLEKAEEPKIKLPTSIESLKKQESSRKNLLLLYWQCQSLCVDQNKLWKILKKMGIPDHLTWLLRNLYAGQEATVRAGHGTTDWFQIGKGVCVGCILSPCLSLLCHPAEYIMWNTGLDEAQDGIKIYQNINNLRYADDTTLMAESKEELKSLLMKVKEEREKTSLKLNIQKSKITTSSPSLHGK